VVSEPERVSVSKPNNVALSLVSGIMVSVTEKNKRNEILIDFRLVIRQQWKYLSSILYVIVNSCSRDLVICY